jgi:ferredoxin-like protein FixX
MIFIRGAHVKNGCCGREGSRKLATLNRVREPIVRRLRKPARRANWGVGHSSNDRKMVKKRLKLECCPFQVFHQPKPGDVNCSIRCWNCGKISVDDDLLSDFVFSHEAVFHLSGPVSLVRSVSRDTWKILAIRYKDEICMLCLSREFGTWAPILLRGTHYYGHGVTLNVEAVKKSAVSRPLCDRVHHVQGYVGMSHSRLLRDTDKQRRTITVTPVPESHSVGVALLGTCWTQVLNSSWVHWGAWTVGGDESSHALTNS